MNFLGGSKAKIRASQAAQSSCEMVCPVIMVSMGCEPPARTAGTLGVWETLADGDVGLLEVETRAVGQANGAVGDLNAVALDPTVCQGELEGGDEEVEMDAESDGDERELHICGGIKL